MSTAFWRVWDWSAAPIWLAMLLIPSLRIWSAETKSCWAPFTSSGVLRPFALLSSVVPALTDWARLCERLVGSLVPPESAVKKLVPVWTERAFSEATLLL